MSVTWRSTLVSLLLVAVVIFLLGAAFVWSGVYNVAADDHHTKPVYELMETLRERSIARHARGVSAPDLQDEALIRQGAGNYDSMCVGCHLAPGATATELSKSLYPAPPALAQARDGSPASDFWIIKHGLKATGMPAWGMSMEDKYVWGMVAFLQRLPKLDAQEYRSLVERSEGHTHGGGEPGEHEPADDHAVAEAEGITHQHADGSTHLHVADKPAAVVDAFGKALEAGDLKTVKGLLDPNVIILESGGAERSRDEYLGHHAKEDAKFLAAAHVTLVRRTERVQGSMAWVTSESRVETRSEKPVIFLGTETMVLQKSGTGWRIVHIHWSSRKK